MTLPTEQDQANAATLAHRLARIHDDLSLVLSPRLAVHLNPGAAPVLLAAQGRVSAELAALEARRAEWRHEGERGGGRAAVVLPERARAGGEASER